MLTPEQAVDRVAERFGRHPHRRALHAKGTICRGHFTPTTEAAGLTRAAHMRGGEVPCTVRFSNGSGDPASPDFAADVRGLAVAFRPHDGTRTDIVAQTAPRFPTRSPDTFVALVGAGRTGPANAWRLPLFMITHPRAVAPLLAGAGAVKPPASYAACTFYGIHAFRWLDASGSAHHVRYTWVPETPAPPLTLREARGRGDDYLQTELVERLRKGPARFALRLQVAAAGDPVDDPTAVWPADRETLTAGTLAVTEPDPDPASDLMIFDPGTVIDGIELTDDPILRFRSSAYSVSYERRTAGR